VPTSRGFSESGGRCSHAGSSEKLTTALLPRADLTGVVTDPPAGWSAGSNGFQPSPGMPAKSIIFPPDATAAPLVATTGASGSLTTRCRPRRRRPGVPQREERNERVTKPTSQSDLARRIQRTRSRAMIGLLSVLGPHAPGYAGSNGRSGP
jgi:hypothetical protein